MDFLDVVCDGSDLTGIWGAEQPDILIVGGYSLDRSALVNLLDDVAAIKKNHGLDSACPVKWNMLDLSKALQLHDLAQHLPILKRVSNALRRELLEALRQAGATIFVSVIVAYSNKKQVLGRTRQDLVSFLSGTY